jgi:hypothetical protein
MKQRGRVLCVEEMENAYRIVIGKWEDLRPLRKLIIRGTMLLKFILKKQHMILTLVKTVMNPRVQTAANFEIN